MMMTCMIFTYRPGWWNVCFSPTHHWLLARICTVMSTSSSFHTPYRLPISLICTRHWGLTRFWHPIPRKDVIFIWYRKDQRRLSEDFALWVLCEIRVWLLSNSWQWGLEYVKNDTDGIAGEFLCTFFACHLSLGMYLSALYILFFENWSKTP